MPRLLQSVSIARSQLIADQLRATVAAGKAGDIVFIGVQSETSDDTNPTMAAVAIVASESDTANLLAIGELELADTPDPESAADRLAIGLVAELRKRGVRFLQWATDHDSNLDPEPPHKDGDPQGMRHWRSCPRDWASRLGIDDGAVLEYLSLELADAPATDGRDSLHASLQVAALEPIAGPVQDEFAELVGATYDQTLDCPELTGHRSAAQILEGYRSQSSYWPSGWHWVTESNNESPVGCLILAQHGANQDGEVGEHLTDDMSPSPNHDNLAVELTYMGLTVQGRGRGLGRALVECAISIARQQRAARMVLAVDQRNRAATKLYHQAGFQFALREQLWFGSL
ncbi:MAG: GNAT family N-acetyltransferase [Planctomycetota bacterium]